jgi:hypothetical protein
VTAPMILHGHGGWDDSVPSWIRGELSHARLDYLHNGGNPHRACELDVTAYLMTASLEAPLGSDWSRIYLYAAFKAMRAYGQGLTTLPDETWVREAEAPLSEYQQMLLDDLRGKIRSAQIRHVKTKRRQKPFDITTPFRACNSIPSKPSRQNPTLDSVVLFGQSCAAQLSNLTSFRCSPERKSDTE